LLEEGAQAHGRETDIWTFKLLVTRIEREFDVEYTPRHCSQILREIGYQPVKPKQEASEKDPEEKRRWLNEGGDRLFECHGYRDSTAV